MLFLSSADFSKFTFSKKFFQEMSNILDPDQDRHTLCPDLAPNCLQRLSADNKSVVDQKRVNFPQKTKEPVPVIFILIAYAERYPLNTLADVSSRASGLNFSFLLI